MSYCNIFRNGLALGHMIECFDNTLYGFFSVLLAPIFFPTHDHNIQILGAFGAFAAGYLTKPLGAFVFGLLGDNTRRSLPLILCIGLVGFPTLFIGLLPSYTSIGIWAPLVLIICRLLQGFFFGGEFAGVNLYLFEHFPQQHLGKNTELLISSGVLGAILASSLGALALADVFPAWGWRIPFIAGGIFSFAAFFLRKGLQTPIIQNHSERKFLNAISDLLKNHKQTMFFCFILSGLTILPLNLATVYANKIFQNLGFSPAQSLVLNCLAMIINALFLIPSGKLADKISFSKMIEYGCMINMIVAIPCFYLITQNNVSGFEAVSFLIILVGGSTAINGCAFPYMASFFPKECRYSGLAISYTLGIGLISGTAPFLATLLSTAFHTELIVGSYIVLLSAFTMIFHRFIVLKAHLSRIEPKYQPL